MGKPTNISKRYSLDTRRERTGFGKGEACILVVYPDLIKFVPAPIIAEKKYIWNSFINVKCGRSEMVYKPAKQSPSKSTTALPCGLANVHCVPSK